MGFFLLLLVGWGFLFGFFLVPLAFCPELPNMEFATLKLLRKHLNLSKFATSSFAVLFCNRLKQEQQLENCLGQDTLFQHIPFILPLYT